MKIDPHTIENDPRWELVLARDRSSDGLFFYSVATTGVFCKPSCASRQANPKNVRFYATVGDCLAAGFRPCKRCKPELASPDTRITDKVTQICKLIDEAEEPPSLAEMAKVAGLSTYHFHRVFKTATGVTPASYHGGTTSPSPFGVLALAEISALRKAAGPRTRKPRCGSFATYAWVAPTLQK